MSQIRSTRPPADRQIVWTRVLGLVFCLGGAMAIFFAWNGAAREGFFVDKQFPYLISGGVGGIAAIVFGVGLLLVAQIRAERSRLTQITDLMKPALSRLQPDEDLEDAEARAQGEHFAFPTRYVRMVALLFAVIGGAMIGLGWSGAASKGFFVDEQFPYLISGGVGGLAMVLFGVGLLLLAQIRTERHKLMRVLEIIARAVARTGEPEFGPYEPGEEPEEGDLDIDGLVVAGPSTFHRPDCRLIQGKPGLDRITIGVARSSGLTACRVCRPISENGQGEYATVGASSKGESSAEAEPTEGESDSTS